MMLYSSELVHRELVIRLLVHSKIDEVSSLARTLPTTAYGEEHTRNPQEPMPAVQQPVHCDFCSVEGMLYGGGHYNGKPYDILSCPTCGLLWTNPLIYFNTREDDRDEEYWAEEVY